MFARPLVGTMLLTALVLASGPLAAQTPEPAPAVPADTAGPAPDLPWLLSYFPYLSGSANDGPAIAGRARYWQPSVSEDRVTARLAVTLDAGFTFRGSRFAILSLDVPHVARDWRVSALVQANRESRFGYYGLGNATPDDESLADSTQPYLYRSRRTRYEGRVELTRRLAGPLSAALAGDVTAARFSALDGPSRFAADFGSTLRQTDVSARLALVVDTRDNEFNTQRGVLLEGGAQLGGGGGGPAGGGYHRLYAILRGYYPVTPRTVVAARLAGSGLGGSAPLNALFSIPAWEQPIDVLGGSDSHRGLRTGRLVGTGVLFGNFEVRQELVAIGGLGALSVIAFVDAGRVFQGENFRVTTSGLAVAGGGGVAVRALQSTIIGITAAQGPDGLRINVRTGWMF